jgi:hypothetical protein
MRGDRTTPYKEDSTKGLSIINPLNYKGDVLVQVWVDSRVLATLMQWLDDQGTYPSYMSQVVRRPLEVLTEVLVEGGDAKLIDNTVEAREMLQRRFKVDLSRGGRGTKNTMHNVTLSIRREDLTDRIRRDKTVYDVNRPLRTNANPIPVTTTEEIEEIKDLSNELSEILNPTSVFKDGNKSYDDTVVIPRAERRTVVVEDANNVSLKIGGTQSETQDKLRRIEEEDRKNMEALNSFDPSTLLAKAIKE